MGPSVIHVSNNCTKSIGVRVGGAPPGRASYAVCVLEFRAF